MKISDVITELENYAPPVLAEEYDNVGLLVGDREREVTSVLLALDVDMGVAEEAKAKGANLIVSHHPLIFDGVKNITADTPLGRCITYLIENKIAVYAAHTNLDSAQGGLNDIMAGILGLENTVSLSGNMADTGIGRVGSLDPETTVAGLAQKLKSVFNLPFIKYTGDGTAPVTRVAVCTGSGASLLDEVIYIGADVYITGDMKYHNVRDAYTAGVNIIELGHYDSEFICTRLFNRILDGVVATQVSESNRNIFNII
ncbi:MAG: Nif3-like dinuclear metal center hexameric protein [Clostridia bacterium]|nr:Nif3-like dinuclear metal center hexameric protein [Clostridia bacterium]